MDDSDGQEYTAGAPTVKSRNLRRDVNLLGRTVYPAQNIGDASSSASPSGTSTHPCAHVSIRSAKPRAMSERRAIKTLLRP